MENKKTSPLIVIWEAIYPVLLYYAILFIAERIFYYILISTTDAMTVIDISQNFPLIQMVGSIVTLPFIFVIYATDRNGGSGAIAYIKEHKPKISFSKIGVAILAIITLVLMSFSLNNLISMSPLLELSKGYKEASNALYSAKLPIILLNSALIVPMLEELTFRGIVLERMKKRMHPVWAIMVSAVLFAIIHANIVQFVFAFILGIVLGLFAHKANHIYPAVIGHMATNLFGVLRTEYKWFTNFADRSIFAWIASLVILLIGAGILALYLRFGKKNEGLI